MTLIANGVDPHGLRYEDALDAAAMLFHTGRAPAPRDWFAMGDDRTALDLIGPL